MWAGLQNGLLILRRRPLRPLVAGLVLGLVGYALWQATPAARFQREFERSEQALAEFDFATARAHAQECVRLRPHDPAGHLLAARAARRDGDLDAATDHLVRYHELVGERTPAEGLEWEMVTAQSGKVQEVLAPLIDALEIRHPASERVLEALAMGCVQVYQFESARFWVEELLAKNPKNAVGRLLRAQTAETLGHREQCQEWLRELVADYPRYAKARLHLAQSLLRTRDYAESAGHFEYLHRSAPDDVAPLLGLARCRILEGRTADAEPLIGQLRERHADNSEALLECGRFAIAQHHFAEAETLLSRCVELAPYDHEAHGQLAICLSQLNRPDEARAHAERTRQIESDLIRLEKAVLRAIKSPADNEARLEAAEICLRNGQEVEGLRWLRGVLERDPNHKPTHRVLEGYYRERGDYRQAEFHRVHAAISASRP